jgi:hypothetical protein
MRKKKVYGFHYLYSRMAYQNANILSATTYSMDGFQLDGEMGNQGGIMNMVVNFLVITNISK